MEIRIHNHALRADVLEEQPIVLKQAEICARQLSPQLPPQTRILDVARDIIARQGTCHFDINSLLHRAQVTKQAFDALYPTMSQLFYVVYQGFYEDTKQRLSHWALNFDKAWSTKSSFEAFLYGLQQICQDKTFFGLFHHLFADEIIFWSVGNYQFDDLYLEDCWITPLSQLFGTIVPNPQAILLAKQYGQSLRDAATHSVIAFGQALNQLITDIPALYSLVNKH